ncbi:hypothetical protein AGABI2DRAFT_134173 [Agaricus bisporus var. bisporus H97]|uniref:hypothetical protein n=1 Tax=Agaricus bisporus var. bisporus (strain H97 / ATCC MYA-4626 / FGSC 10389) TaxID=936046 RepID=UPI00029F7FEF|nr:hypothetical protein AGABI2DRAFT_134173 [Agaricus bisporus var. bisporus H97]EKV50401.1 hypothetical protein AGABI2DRAFT_134173 [Agaricus bisporus var. bisporus H97]
MMFAQQPVDDLSVAAPSPPLTPQNPAHRRAQTRPNSTTASPSPAEVSSQSTTPVKLSLSSGSSPSQISSPSHQTCLVQCSGFTKAQKQCARMIKTDSLIGDSSRQIERFCHQHTKEVLINSGYYSKRNDNWVDFNLWICPYLQESTQATLRAEMVKARSAQDEPGHIYTFEIRDPGSKTIRLKVGRATNVVKRLDQWTKQCGSEEQVPRGVYPENVEQDGSSLMKGRIQAGEKAPFCHRLERLIHIELADLASTCVYLQPGWPHIDTPPSTSGSPKKKTKGKENACNTVCPDCGARHNEIFEFKRWEKGANQGKEWERIVKPVIERWGKFVELYV